ncbi:hypothetical protein [Nostoc sphaeroides]|uniref:Uncharacterized protein n=1 Tax=Nostoc sphaeroides CCNUC1 TaxID=2653204 RepID=A0A5P8VRE5_9NOSO|nr:hypothetical protein [Nostoc sphaeroides]QFS42985.1 hypothetical protein GXM_00458 [Nostoc sphaeroides CCNUC1]
MESQKKQQLIDDIKSELSESLDNCDPNSSDSKSAVKKQKIQAFAIAFTSENSAPSICGEDEDGNPVCQE